MANLLLPNWAGACAQLSRLSMQLGKYSVLNTLLLVCELICTCHRGRRENQLTGTELSASAEAALGNFCWNVERLKCQSFHFWRLFFFIIIMWKDERGKDKLTWLQWMWLTYQTAAWGWGSSRVVSVLLTAVWHNRSCLGTNVRSVSPLSKILSYPAVCLWATRDDIDIWWIYVFTAGSDKIYNLGAWLGI